MEPELAKFMFHLGKEEDDPFGRHIALSKGNSSNKRAYRRKNVAQGASYQTE